MALLYYKPFFTYLTVPNSKQLELEIEKIKARNMSVGADKAWETSYTRRVILMIFIYIAVGLYFSAIKLPNGWLDAIVPSIGFLLSTLTIPFFKSIWLRHIYRR